MLKQKKITVDGVEYTLQGLSARDYYKCMNKKDEYGNFDVVGVYDYFFEHVIVAPKVSFEDFESEDFDKIERLMAEVNTFLKTKNGEVGKLSKK